MSGLYHELTIPDDHWLKLASIDDLVAFLRYYKIKYEISNNIELYQAYILRAAADNKKIYKLVTTNSIDYTKYRSVKSRARSTSKEKLIDVSHLNPINLQLETEKENERRAKKRNAASGGDRESDTGLSEEELEDDDEVFLRDGDETAAAVDNPQSDIPISQSLANIDTSLRETQNLVKEVIANDSKSVIPKPPKKN